ncbi:DUF397 domain-containing protein [Sphaerisporangium corydalis]|uniref:DUF397 domain-containing protein n=1 Tax=Sphaerisporangium corydalis TaxID=1441875 RepID=A0ABV9ED27_9ACTN|nr:DUF397 domain-containing protein [Sphaerisporangium corydalis]
MALPLPDLADGPASLPKGDFVDEITVLAWRKSSFSASGDNCVEVADLPDGGCAVRDSKAPSGMRLQVSAREWRTFVHEVKRVDQGETAAPAAVPHTLSGE